MEDEKGCFESEYDCSCNTLTRDRIVMHVHLPRAVEKSLTDLSVALLHRRLAAFIQLEGENSN